MKWYAISGSWLVTNETVKKDVVDVAKKIIFAGDGIITGGALGVDYFATQTVLNFGDPKKQLKLYLPVKLEALGEHFFRRADEGVITHEQAEMVTAQLRHVYKIAPKCIFDDWGFTEADIESYYGRTIKIIEDCDELYAFQVNNSQGTQDAIDIARQMNKAVYLKKYDIK